MKFRSFASACLTALLLFSTAPASFAAAEGETVIAPEAVIFPVDRATMLAGSVLDVKVELNHLPSEATGFDVKVGDVDADTYFGKAAQAGSTSLDGQYKIWTDVSFATTGDVTISVSGAGEGWTLEKSVGYTVWETGDAQAKNVILIVGDGLALPARTAARIVSKGLTEGKYNGYLAMDDMDQTTLVTTSGLNSLVTDSANSASAYSTGHKTSNNAMGVYTFNPNDAEQVAPRVQTMIEYAKQAGMSTGLVSTSEIEDATPAAMYVHIPQRGNKQAVADQLFNETQRPDVVLGGGAAYFWPQETVGSKRKDSRDLTADFETAGYTFVSNATELASVDTQNTNQLLGLFHSSNMSVYVDKAIEKDPAILSGYEDQPMLYDMTKTAIDILSKNEDGFFLLVEGASIDKQLHAMQWERAIWDTIEMDKAVAVAKDFADQNGDTLVIVVADHSHSMSVYGTVDYSMSGREAVRVYEAAGWPTYQDNDGDGFPDTGADEDGDGKFDQIVETDIALAIGWGNHPDYVEDFKYDAAGNGPAVVANDKAVANYQGVGNGGVAITGNLPYDQTQEVHSADDIPLTAYGAGSQFFDRPIMDNTEVFGAIANALGLKPAAK